MVVTGARALFFVGVCNGSESLITCNVLVASLATEMGTGKFSPKFGLASLAMARVAKVYATLAIDGSRAAFIHLQVKSCELKLMETLQRNLTYKLVMFLSLYI